MPNRWFDYFRSPTFDVAQKSHRAKNLHILLLTILALEIILAVFAVPGETLNALQTWYPRILALILLAITLLLIRDNRTGHTDRAANIQFGILWIALVTLAALFGGLQHPIFIFMGSIVIMVALTLTLREVYLYLVASIATAFLLYFAQVLLPKGADLSSKVILINYTISFILLGILLWVLRNNLSEAYRRALNSENQRNDANEALKNSQLIFEAQVTSHAQQRTFFRALSFLNELGQEKKDEDQLLAEMVSGIAEILEIDHAAIFILDNANRYAFLRAANSQVGQDLMKDKGYRLSVRRSSVLSGSGTAGMPELIIRQGNESYHISRPIPMPGMSTENNYSLISKGNLIGILNLQTQSGEEGQPEQEQFMRMIAAHIAQTIQTNRFQDQISAQSLQLETLSGERISDAWKRISSGDTLNYRFDRIRTINQTENIPAKVLQELQSGQSSTYRTPKQTLALAAPIQLSGQVIGLIGYELESSRNSATTEEIAMLNSIASQISVALENARLFAESQQRAQNERMIYEVTNQMRESLDLETVLRSATREIQRALNVQSAEIRLGTLTEKPENENESG